MNEDMGYNYDINFRYRVEQEILGGIMDRATRDVWPECRDMLLKHQLLPQDFRDEDHKSIWLAIQHCMEKDQLPTLMRITSLRPTEYRNNNASQFEFKLVQCINLSLANTRSIYQDILILKQFVLMDFWNEQAHLMLYGNWNNRDVILVGDTVVQKYEKLMNRFTEKIKVSGKNSYEQELAEKMRKRQMNESVAVPFCVHSVDEFFEGGTFAGELVIIAARPGMGKTTLALISAWNSHKKGHKTAFFSLEMPRNQLINKIASLETGIDYKKIKGGRITTEEYARVVDVHRYIEESGFLIFDDVKYVEDISIKSREIAEKYGITKIVIDYIQRCKVKSTKKIREVVIEISREFKSIAKDNYVSVIALSQLSRAVEQRPNKRPLLSDLKESSSIEEDADIVAFLYCQAYYDIQQQLPVSATERFHTEFIVAKGRDLGTIILHLWVDPISMTAVDYRIDGNYEPSPLY